MHCRGTESGCIKNVTVCLGWTTLILPVQDQCCCFYLVVWMNFITLTDVLENTLISATEQMLPTLPCICPYQTDVGIGNLHGLGDILRGKKTIACNHSIKKGWILKVSCECCYRSRTAQLHRNTPEITKTRSLICHVSQNKVLERVFTCCI